MKTIIRIVIIIALAYGVYWLVDKPAAQNLRSTVQSRFVQEQTQEDWNSQWQEEFPQIIPPEQTWFVSSENTLILDYVFEDTAVQESGEQIQKDIQQQTSNDQPQEEKVKEVTPPTQQGLTADDYRDLQKLWQNLVE